MKAPEVVGYGEVDDAGMVLVHDRKAFMETVGRTFLGRKVQFTVRAYSRKRSTRANNFYWAALVDSIADWTGYNKTQVHEMLKTMFLQDVMFVELPDGTMKETIIPRSTAELTKEEFTEYVQKCEAFAAELGIEDNYSWSGDRYSQ